MSPPANGPDPNTGSALDRRDHRPGLFHTTHWSVVLAVGGSDPSRAHASLAALCQTYWYPLYCCVRRHGYSPEDAQDLTQSFFAKLLENDGIASADPERGRFRTFLLRSLENHLRTAHRDRTAQKRGGVLQPVSWDAQTAEERYGREPLDPVSPAALFERQWAVTLLDRVLELLRLEFLASGREELFTALEPHLWGDETSVPHAQIGRDLGMTSVAVRVTLHRLRQRFADLVRSEIANTVAEESEVEAELEHLWRLLAA
jgi:RNA polymerase sigma factor (sigma-70 family)